MVPKKQPTTGGDTTSKYKYVATVGGIVFPSDLNPIVKEMVSHLLRG